MITLGMIMRKIELSSGSFNSTSFRYNNIPSKIKTKPVPPLSTTLDFFKIGNKSGVLFKAVLAF